MLYRGPPPPAFKYANHKNNRTKKKIYIIQLKNRQTNKKFLITKKSER